MSIENIMIFDFFLTLINRFIRNRVMAETLKLQKRGLGFLIIKGSIFNIFKNGKKLHTLQLHTSSVCFCFFCPKRGLYCPKDFKKVNIFEISSLEVYNRVEVGCPGSVLRPYMYICI